MILSTGTQLGRYEIRSQLGAGGMGEVYLASDTRLHRKVAVKILPADFSAESLRRFEQEACAASALNHPNILTIYETGQEDSTHYIATEFIDGVTLREAMQSSQVSLSESLSVAIQILSALAAAHDAGIVHRDIKPENVMLRADGLVKILDFGLAKLTQTQPHNLDGEALTKPLVKTSPGLVMGTVSYMSPEQARGKDVDARSDVWSLGVVLYEMLAGKVPFAGETTSDCIAAILKNDPLPLSQFNPDVPSEVERIILKTLAKDRDERYRSAKDLLIELQQLNKRLEFEAEHKRASTNEASTAQTVLLAPAATDRKETPTTEANAHGKHSPHDEPQAKRNLLAVALLGLSLLAVVAFGVWYYANRPADSIESIAVLPFINESGNADIEYLSDGMTESLITSLSQLPNLNIKARSSVFRYKGRDADARTVGRELSVQAVLTGRVIARGEDLALYIELVDAATENVLWKADYKRQMANLATLQSEIARDVADKLRLRLSGAEAQRLAKNYTENAEAYQLYLKGRYHLNKLTPPDIQTSVAYFQRAIAIDPSYALAYVGLADANRALALSVDLPATEFFPKSKAAANKAIEIDDTLAEAHAGLGFAILFYDWDWKAAENHYKRALELNPNSADTHLAYAGLFSVTGRLAEALSEVKRAREIDPLNLRANALEGQFLILAGQTDEGLGRLQKTFELEPTFFLAHLFASSAYIQKGMYGEAIAEATRARDLSGGNAEAIAAIGYALAMSGKRDEARAVLDELKKRATECYVPPYAFALVHHGLGERGEAFAWLERGIEQRDPKMIFLKFEPKWNNLHGDPRFQDLLRRVGFPQ